MIGVVSLLFHMAAAILEFNMATYYSMATFFCLDAAKHQTGSRHVAHFSKLSNSQDKQTDGRMVAL